MRARYSENGHVYDEFTTTLRCETDNRNFYVNLKHASTDRTSAHYSIQ